MKRKSSEPVVVSLPRRSKRVCRSSSDVNGTPFVPFKRVRKGGATIGNLPSEILFKIFSHFSPRELFYNIRRVSRRWRELAMCPILWKSIEVCNNEVPTHVLLRWLQTSTLLRTFSVTNRNDADIVLDAVSIYCRQLEEIKIQNCWGSSTCITLHCSPLCNLISRCKNLYSYNFSQTKFNSCKFFKLISRDMNSSRVMKRCNYVGPMTTKQMHALFAALRDYEVHDTATIGNVSVKQKYKLRDLIEIAQDDKNLHQGVVNEIWQNLINDTEDLGEADHPFVIL